MEVQVPSRQRGNSKSWCVYHEELNFSHDSLFLQILTTRFLRPSFHCSRRAAGDREHRRQMDRSPVRCNAAPKPKLVSNWNQSTRLESKFEQDQNTNEMVASLTFPSTSRTFYDTQDVTKLTEQYDAHIFLTCMEDAAADKPRMERCEDQNRTFFTFVQYKSTVMVLHSIQTCFLWNRYRWIGRNTCSTRAALPTMNESRRIESKKQETSLFLLTSGSARIAIETTNDRLGRTRWWIKNGTVQAKLSPRSRLYLLLQPTTCSTRKFGISSK